MNKSTKKMAVNTGGPAWGPDTASLAQCCDGEPRARSPAFPPTEGRTCLTPALNQTRDVTTGSFLVDKERPSRPMSPEAMDAVLGAKGAREGELGEPRAPLEWAAGPEAKGQPRPFRREAAKSRSTASVGMFAVSPAAFLSQMSFLTGAKNSDYNSNEPHQPQPPLSTGAAGQAQGVAIETARTGRCPGRGGRAGLSARKTPGLRRPGGPAGEVPPRPLARSL